MESIPWFMEVKRRKEAFFFRYVDGHPSHIGKALKKRYVITKDREGEAAANTQLREYGEYSAVLPANANADTIRDWAHARARDCARVMQVHDDPEQQWAAGFSYARRFDIDGALPSQAIPFEGAVARMACGKWWRRQARRLHMRRLEQQARQLGLVHRRAGVYVSDDAFARWQGNQLRNVLLMQDTYATNERGETYSMAELAELGVSNPKLRRAELMVRIRGIEEVATETGDIGLFITWTAPGRMHSHLSKTCHPNSRYDGSSPRDVQGYFRKLWARARVALARKGITLYGLRVAEPHHDGTPHWHMMCFVDPKKAAQAVDILRGYAMADTPDERGAEKYRFKAVYIDPRKGTAAGYCAKYVAKCVDGHAVGDVTNRGEDGETYFVDLDADDAALRVRAWASDWGIRQFQFFGCPPVTAWRELRRLDAITNNPIAEDLRLAADAGDWARYMKLQGGACQHRDCYPAKVIWETTGEIGEYGDPVKMPLVKVGLYEYISRPHTWQIEYKPPGEDRSLIGGPNPSLSLLPKARVHEAYSSDELERISEAEKAGRSLAPWTCVNNCTQPTGGKPDYGE